MTKDSTMSEQIAQANDFFKKYSALQILDNITRLGRDNPAKAEAHKAFINDVPYIASKIESLDPEEKFFFKFLYLTKKLSHLKGTIQEVSHRQKMKSFLISAQNFKQGSRSYLLELCQKHCHIFGTEGGADYLFGKLLTEKFLIEETVKPIFSNKDLLDWAIQTNRKNVVRCFVKGSTSSINERKAILASLKLTPNMRENLLLEDYELFDLTQTLNHDKTMLDAAKRYKTEDVYRFLAIADYKATKIELPPHGSFAEARHAYEIERAEIASTLYWAIQNNQVDLVRVLVEGGTKSINERNDILNSLKLSPYMKESLLLEDHALFNLDYIFINEETMLQVAKKYGAEDVYRFLAIADLSASLRAKEKLEMYHEPSNTVGTTSDLRCEETLEGATHFLQTTYPNTGKVLAPIYPTTSVEDLSCNETFSDLIERSPKKPHVAIEARSEEDKENAAPRSPIKKIAASSIRIAASPIKRIAARALSPTSHTMFIRG